MKTVELGIEGMSCGHCVRAVESALGGVEHARDVRVELEQGRATVRLDPEGSERDLVAAVDDVGYSATVRG